VTVQVIGCSHRTAPVEVRERLAFAPEKLEAALDDLAARYGCEAVILSTCNRVEMYLARSDPSAPIDPGLLTEFLGETHSLPVEGLKPCLFTFQDADAARHLFRVASSLDSMIVGEGQIAGQVKRAYELAQEHGSVGPALHSLFQQAHQVAKRVRSETGIARGHVSVSSAAVEYVRQVFDHFGDKTILVIGAGKMGEMTLRHLRQLQPQRIWVTNRSPEKAQTVAAGCGGTAILWEQLDQALAGADIVLSTTGAPEPIMTQQRFEGIRRRRTAGPVVILDIAVPRDFDPRIHDGDRTCLFNIDDLKRIREQTLAERARCLGPAEAIVEDELRRFLKDWSRRRHAPVIARLTKDLESKRQAIVAQLIGRLNGRLSNEDQATIEGAFRLLQNQFLHGPLSALADEPHEEGKHTLVDAFRKLFRLQD
jgi:glutamyl-tRNA reductase